MFQYPIFAVFVVFALFTFVYMRRTNNAYQKQNEEFLEREREANSVRKQPITDLEYVTLNLNELPTIDTDDEYLIERFKTLQFLADDDTKICNLSVYTNTELKLKYGVANLTLLTQYDQNFINLCRCLYEIGNRLYNASDVENAKAYLEYGIKCGTDLKLHYTLLADIYEQNMQYKDIVKLIHSAENMHSALKQSLIKDLKKRLDDTNYTAEEEPVPLEDISSTQ